jgi:hypothetical protein
MAFSERTSLLLPSEGVRTQVANAVTITTSSAMLVFCTTLSMVIGPVAACVPGVPTLQVEGSFAVPYPWYAAPLPP